LIFVKFFLQGDFQVLENQCFVNLLAAPFFSMLAKVGVVGSRFKQESRPAGQLCTVILRTYHNI
jgi:hypothetical protein